GAAAVGRVSADIADAVEDARRVAAVVGATGRFSPTLARTTSPVLDAVAFVRPVDHGFVVDGVPGLAPDALAGAVPTLDLVRDIGALLGSGAAKARTGRPDLRAPVLVGGRQWDLSVVRTGSGPARSGAAGFAAVTILLAGGVVVASTATARARARTESAGAD